LLERVCVIGGGVIGSLFAGYLARVTGVPGQAALQAIATGVPLEDGITAPAKARVLGADRRGNAEVEITVTEGRNRLVRRTLLKVGHPVLELRRESFAGITLRGMKHGEVRELTAAEVQRLQGMADRLARKQVDRSRSR